MNYHFLSLSGLQVCRHLFEVRFHPSRNRVHRLPLVTSPCGRDVSTLIDIFIMTGCREADLSIMNGSSGIATKRRLEVTKKVWGG